MMDYMSVKVYAFIGYLFIAFLSGALAGMLCLAIVGGDRREY